MADLTAQRHGHLVAEATAFRQVKDRLAAGDNFPPEPAPDLPGRPAEALAEVETLTAKLVAGGWSAEGARLIALSIVADRWGQTIN